MKQSNFLSLGWRDIARGLAMAALVPAWTIIQQSIEAGVLVFNWQDIGMAAIAGIAAYLSKNLFTQPDKKD